MSILSRAVLTVLMLVAVIAADVRGGYAQTAVGGETFVINLRDTDIQVFAEQISRMTGRTLVLDPKVAGKVTVISSEPLDGEEVWSLFQSVLRVNGFAAVRSGQVWRVVPQTSAAQGGTTIDRTGTPDSQDFVTRLVRLRNLPSAEALRVLKPLVASFGILEALERPNAIVITDSAENVRRVESLALSLDAGDGSGYATFRLRYANAAAAANVLSEILGDTMRVSVDERSNTLLVKGSGELISQARELIAGLDKPGEGATTTRVIRLKYADAESVINVLRGLTGGGAGVTNPVARALSEPEPTFGIDGGGGSGGLSEQILGTATASRQQSQPSRSSGGSGQSSGSSGFSGNGIAVETAPDINAIVARGNPTAVAQVEELVASLDIRRPQVMIEAAIVEISGDIAEQFGVQLGIGDTGASGGLAATSFSNSGTSLQSVLRLLGVPASAALSTDGLSIGANFGGDFSILVQALASSSKANLMSTPSLTTLDNQSAEIIVGQNVPFRTGSFTTPGNTIQPFTTITRENVGISMRVLPRINDGDVIRLEVSQEVSSLVNANVPGAADLITNRRSIQTTVLADNGSTIVLGGLITNDQTSSDAKVPGLGDVPLLGNVFRSKKKADTRRTLYVFLRPTILRGKHDVEAASQGKYTRLREVEVQADTESLLMTPTYRKLPLEIEGIY
ncbi:MAG: type II secretion system secretin GspD [Rhizobiaceae bacterium]|nr:type II secretion system secretin GspD [Rhizobiaceae bacterium]